MTDFTTPPSGGQPLRVLVVHDDASTRLALRAALTPAALVLLAEDAQAAEAVLASTSVRLVLCAETLPDAFGRSVLARVQRQHVTTPGVLLVPEADADAKASPPMVDPTDTGTLWAIVDALRNPHPDWFASLDTGAEEHPVDVEARARLDADPYAREVWQRVRDTERTLIERLPTLDAKAAWVEVDDAIVEWNRLRCAVYFNLGVEWQPRVAGT